ncbi:TetR/AcrR family transcriptional regulator [Gordonia sputi]
MTSEQPLRRASIVDASIEILNRDGVEGLSMRTLAAELHLRPMTLYYHVPNKAALLSMVITEVTSHIEWPTYRGDPRTRMLAQCSDVFETLCGIPWMADMFRAGASIGLPPLRLAEQFLGAANELGLSDAHSVRLWRSVWFLMRSELQWDDATRSYPEDIPWYRAISPEAMQDFPTVARLVPHWGEYTSGYDVLTYVATLIDGTVVAFGKP